MLLVTGFQFWVVFVKGQYSPQSCFYNILTILITDLELSGYGANIGNIFAGYLLYSDDIVLLSPTCRGLQKLITACESMVGCGIWNLIHLKVRWQLLAANAQLTQ